MKLKRLQARTLLSCLEFSKVQKVISHCHCEEPERTQFARRRQSNLLATTLWLGIGLPRSARCSARNDGEV